MVQLTEAQITKSLLVVDDIPSARKVTMRFLTRLGFKSIKEASSRAEAAEVITNTYISLIISDIHLKDGMGFAILDTLIELERSIPILFITSDFDESAYEAAQSYGRKIDYLLKPFSPESLSEKISVLI